MPTHHHPPPASTDPLENRYRLESLIGSGGMGHVYRGVDEQSERPIAVKILHESHAADRNRLRFQREFRILTRLSHPHILAVYDYGQTPAGNAFLVMELLEGMDLNRWRATQGDVLHYPTVHTLITQICQALAHIHNQGIIHRDIKPSNIMITSSDPPNIKLMDFGLARPQQDDTQVTQEGVVLGTLTYIAPELIQGKQADRRADLYSLGIVLYELLAGERPFSTGDMMAMALQHLTSKPRSLSSLAPNLPQGWEQIILRLLEKSPAQRFQSAEDVLEALGSPPESFSTPHFTPHADLIFESPFLGRSEPMEQVQHWLEKRNTLLMTHGEAGVGKSTFLAQIGELARELGWEPFTGQVYEGSHISYQPIVEILRQLNRKHALEPTKTWQPLLTLLPELSTTAATQQWTPLPELGSEANRLRLFNAISQILLGQSKRQPLLLLFDNLQWADEGTLALINYLAHDAAGRSFLLAGAYRTEELPNNPALEQLIHTLKHGRRLEEITLGPLGAGEVEWMVNAMLGLTTSIPGLGRRIFAETEGNPFFIKEIIKYWVEVGVLLRQGGMWVKQKTAPLTLPPTLRDLILRRLKQLDQRAQSALRAAAVIGTTFSFDLWLSITQLEEENLLDVLDNLIRARLVEERSTDSEELIGFTHHKIQTLIYTELTSQRRLRLHLQVAEELQSSAHSDPAELARHYLAAEKWDLALAYTRQAIHRASAQYDGLRALALCQQALGIFDHLSLEHWASEKAALLHDIAERLYYLGRFEQAVEVANQAIELARQHQLEQEEAQALVDLARYAEFADKIEVVEAALENAERLVRGREQGSIHAQILQAWGRSWYKHTREFDRIITVMLQAANIYRRLGDDRGTANCLREAANARYYLNELAASIPLHQESLSIQRQQDDLVGVAVGLKDLAQVYLGLGRHAEAEKTLREAVGLTQRIGLFWVQTNSSTALAWTLMAQNRWDEAAVFFQIALKAAQSLGRPSSVADVMCQFGDFNRWLGQRARSRSFYEEALEISEQTGDENIATCSRVGLLRLALLENRPAGAARHTGKLSRLNKDKLTPGAQMAVATGLAKLAVAQGRPAEGLVATDKVLTLTDSVEEWDAAMDLLDARASALMALGQHAEATSVWTHILTHAESRACTYRQWYAGLVLAKLESDPSKAEEYISYARSLLEQAAAGIANPDERAIFWSTYRRGI